MHRRITHTALATALFVLLAAGPASAQTGGPDVTTLEHPSTDMGGFAAFAAVAFIVGAGLSIWKFIAVRDMGIRRGLSDRDATTAALFSQDRVTSAMVLKPDTEEGRRRDRLRGRSPRAPRTRDETTPRTIEQRLAQVASLHDRGIISAEEAASRRDEILDEI